MFFFSLEYSGSQQHWERIDYQKWLMTGVYHTADIVHINIMIHFLPVPKPPLKLCMD